MSREELRRIVESASWLDLAPNDIDMMTGFGVRRRLAVIRSLDQVTRGAGV